MFERLMINLHKRAMQRRIRKAIILIRKNRLEEAEKIYSLLIDDYKEFCKKAAYLEKISVYHNLVYLYDELSKKGEKEEKPELTGKRTEWAVSVKKETAQSGRKKARVKRAKKKKKKPKRNAGKKIRKETVRKAKAKAMPRKTAKPVEKTVEEEKIPEESRIEEKAIEGKKIEEKNVEEKPKAEKTSAIPPKPTKIQKGQFTTVIDELYSYVQEKGNATITDAALKFKVSRDKIEELAKILEEHGLIKLFYPAFTSPQLLSMEWIDKEEKRKREKAESGKKRIDKKIEAK